MRKLNYPHSEFSSGYAAHNRGHSILLLFILVAQATI
jgi:hypothetical protein